MMKLLLSARPPFNFLSVVSSHGWRQLAPFSYDETEHILSYVMRLSSRRVIEIRFSDGTVLDITPPSAAPAPAASLATPEPELGSAFNDNRWEGGVPLALLDPWSPWNDF